MRRVKQALGLQLLLELLKGDVQVAHAVGREGVAVELIRPVARKHAHAPRGDDLHAVFRSEAQPQRGIFEHHAAQRAALVLERKIMVPRGINFVVADLAAHSERRQVLVPIKQEFEIAVELGDGKDILLHQRASCKYVSTATPRALSVEYCGWANTGANCAQRTRSMELDATPPENTTASPGYSFRAAAVAAATA